MQPEALVRTRGSGTNVTAVVIFVLLAVAGVFYAKWDPYFLKLATVSSTHTLGASIVSGTARSAPPVGLSAAVTYFLDYFKDIWVALVVGLVIGAGVQTLLPREWLLSVLGRTGWGSATVAAACAVPSMMCTCCSAPIAVSLKKQQVSTGAVLAYWVGNPVLNPATIVFMGFVLGWNWAVLRILMGIVLVAGAIYIGNRWGRDHEAERALQAVEGAVPASAGGGSEAARFFRTLGRLALTLLPEYIIIVGVLGAVRAWLFPALTPGLGHSLLLTLGLAVAGTLFVIPTAAEIPIVQSLMSYGLGLASAGTLMMTLPAVSLPSLAMVSQAVSRATLARLALWVAVAGLITGGLAHFLL
jgi:uncharacterized membrane protein YraQ (UPF0718 family)